MIRVNDVRTGYGRAEVLHGVSLEVKPGRITAIIGPNGAGKTTLMSAIAGTRPVWAGNVQLDDEDVTKLSAPDRVQRGIVLCPEGRRIFSSLTVEENIRIGATTLHHKAVSGEASVKLALESAFEMFPILGERRHKAGGTLSGGQQQMLALARALASRPKFLLLDEPSLGLAPAVIERVYEALGELRSQGLGMVLVEEGADRALEFADFALVLNGGRVVLEGTAAELQSRHDLATSYLGEM